MDWAEIQAREIVVAYRQLFRDGAPGAADGLINLVAGELRAAESNARRDAAAAPRPGR